MGQEADMEAHQEDIFGVIQRLGQGRREEMEKEEAVPEVGQSGEVSHPRWYPVYNESRLTFRYRSIIHLC